MEDKYEIIYKSKLEKQLNRFLHKARQFCDNYCIPYGLHSIISSCERQNISHNILYNDALSDDFDYFIFTKSTKTLHAIKKLIKDQNYHFNEDIMNMIRSIFEGHLTSRYLRDTIGDTPKKEEAIRELIKSPIGLITDYYIKKRNFVQNKNGDEISRVKGPSCYKKGEDVKYYQDFYSFLCQFTHSNYGTLRCYFDGTFYRYDSENLTLEALLFSVFIFTKLVEAIVTVQGESFTSKDEENSYYDLVYDSIDLQYDVFDYLITKYSGATIEKIDWIIQFYLFEGNPKDKNQKMVNMLAKMKDSLYEEIGSLSKKDIDEQGKLIRQYPIKK